MKWTCLSFHSPPTLQRSLDTRVDRTNQCNMSLSAQVCHNAWLAHSFSIKLALATQRMARQTHGPGFMGSHIRIADVPLVDTVQCTVYTGFVVPAPATTGSSTVAFCMQLFVHLFVALLLKSLMLVVACSQLHNTAVLLPGSCSLSLCVHTLHCAPYSIVVILH